MKRIIVSAVLAGTILVTGGMTAQGEEGYPAVYANAIAESLARHESMEASGEIFAPYDAMSYAVSDITGDGEEELLIRQMLGKHLSRFWTYSYDGTAVSFMGEFENDAYLLYGYEEGVLYREHYKGSVSLGLAEWNGREYTNTILYSGTYDRDGDPPSVEALAAYYNPSRLLDEVPEFTLLAGGSDYGTLVDDPPVIGSGTVSGGNGGSGTGILRESGSRNRRERRIRQRRVRRHGGPVRSVALWFPHREYG